jgi:hypothetical protein
MENDLYFVFDKDHATSLPGPATDSTEQEILVHLALTRTPPE